MEFRQYLTEFASQGETTLIVRQKETKEQHKDGSTRYTWPAYLPSKWKDNGSAWYGNTGLFIIDRFKDGKPSASASCVEFVGCMVLDDIGTKSKTPPLPPTWVMETSEGNYQWGYGFSEQPPKGEFSAAIIAIADAGYTDKGAINPVRNFRLPGSVNLKPGKNNFAAKLIEFHPECEYSLTEICAALEVTPAPADTASFKPISTADDGTDDIMAWLTEQSLVLEGVNAAGWAGVVCPNAAEHTDDSPMGRYSPINRAYCCLHAHCGDWDSERFLSWVEDEGGPAHQGGFRSELLAAVMAPAIAKIEQQKESSPFSPETNADATIKEVEAKELGRIEQDHLHDHFVYIEDDDAYFDLRSRREVSRSTFNALYRHLNCTRDKKRIESATWFDMVRNKRGSRTLVGLTYAAGESMLCARDGLVYGNRWMDARPVGIPGSIAPWMAHLEGLIPEKFERQHLLDVMAHKVQHPNVKINHAVLLGGHPGIGKDTVLAPFFYAVCGQYNRNLALVDTKVLESQFGYGLESEIMVVNELRPDQFKDRRALENTLKPIIAAPPEYLTVNRKGLHPYQAVNRVLVVAMSNFRDAIALPSNDRRWFCLWSNSAMMAVADSRRLWDWYKNGGFSAVAAWLLARDVSHFNPAAAPPMTEAKIIMLEQSRTSAEEYMVEYIAQGMGDFAKGAVRAPFHRIADRMKGNAPADMKINQYVLMHALQEAGWIDLGRIKGAASDPMKRTFCKNGMHLTHNKAELYRIAGEEPDPTLKLVK